MRFAFGLLGLVLACNADGSRDPADGGGGAEGGTASGATGGGSGASVADTEPDPLGGPTDGTAQTGGAVGGDALSCGSLAFCTSHKVKTFAAEPTVPEGGAIADGVYVLAWETEAGDESVEGYGADVEVIVVEGGRYVGSGFAIEGHGTISTRGTTLTLTEARQCRLGEDNGDSDEMYQFRYTAMDDRLILQTPTTNSDGVESVIEHVFLRRSAEAICDTVDIEPDTPGPSAQCVSVSCYCRIAVEGTLDPDSC